MRIILIRHPQTEANEKKIIYGRMDYPYSLIGEDQFSHVTDYVSSYLNHIQQETTIVTSPKQRTVKIAEKIKEKTGRSYSQDGRISEMDFGIFEGLTLEEVERQYPKEYEQFRISFSDQSIRNGESYTDFSERVLSFIEEKIEPYREESRSLCIITHGAVLREILARLLAIESEELWKLQLNNGCMVRLNEKKGRFYLEALIQVEDMQYVN